MTEPSATGRRYAGKTADERRAERRDRLLDAGLELFGTQGFGATTIEMLCAAARLNPRYFYEQFETREAVLGAVYDRHIQAVTATVVEAIAQAPLEPLARLEAGLRAFLDSVLSDERAARINYFEMVGVSPQLDRKRRDVLRAYADMIAAQIAETTIARRIPVDDYRLAAVALVGAIDGLIIDWLSNEQRGDREAIIATVLGIVEPALKTAGTGTTRGRGT